MSRRWLVRSLITLGALGLVPFVYAQSPSPTGADAPLAAAANLLPRVYVTDLKAQPDGSRKLSGSFTVENTESQAVGDVRYDIVILGPAPTAIEGEFSEETHLLYARSRQAEALSLLPSATKQVTFSYQAPLLPPGEYRLRIQLVTSNDRELGWDTIPLTLGGDTPFALFDDYFVEAVSTEVETGAERQRWAPFEGVNVDPGQEVILVGTVMLQGNTPLTATPRITTRRILSATTVETTENGQSLTLAAGSQPRELALPLKAQTTPGAYRVVATLQDAASRQVSNVAEFRYVVRGNSASVVSVTLAALEDSSATINYTVVGPADRQTSLDGVLDVTLLDGSGSIGNTQQPVTLNLAAVSGTAIVALDRPAEKPGIRLTLKTRDGAVLDAYEVPFEGISATELTEGAVARPYPRSYLKRAGILLLLALLVVTSFEVLRRRRKNRRLPPTAPLVAILLLILAQGFFAGQIQASGVQFSWWRIAGVGDPAQHPLFTVFVNEPRQGQRFTVPPATIPYSARMAWVACDNRAVDSAITLNTKAGEAAPRDQTDWFAHWPQIPDVTDRTWFRPGTMQSWTRIAGQTWGRGFDSNQVGSGSIDLRTPLTVTGISGPLTLWTNARTTQTHTGDFWERFGYVGGHVDDFTTIYFPTECSDRVDNSDPEDSLVDTRDPGCHTDGNVSHGTTYDPNDNDERDQQRPQCSDGIDNADTEDTLADQRDAGCHTDANPGNSASYDPNDNDERNTQCSDAVDNADTEDALIDRQDPGCHDDYDASNQNSYNPADNNEFNPQCSDFVDNADPEDTLADSADPGCHTDRNVNNSASYTRADNNESNVPVQPPQCSDGRDNADIEDSLADSADPGCHTDQNQTNSSSYDPNDNDERHTPRPQCSDFVDNADTEDNLADQRDPGCHTDGVAGRPRTYDPNDNDEGDVVAIPPLPSSQCSDGRDNADTEDSLADSADPGCHTDGNPSNPASYDPSDTNESNPPAAATPQCSDGIDNADPEDTLADSADPGCHTDKNPNNPDSYRPTRNTESDIDVGDFFEDDPS